MTTTDGKLNFPNKPDSHKSEVKEHIIDLDFRMKILQAVLDGKPDTQLAQELGVSTTKISKLRADIAQTLTQAYLEKVEHVRALAHARLEQLYAASAPWALGTRIINAGTEQEKSIGIPDRHWVNTCLKIIEAQLRLTTPDWEMVQRRERETGNTLNFSDIKSLTIVSGDDLFQHSQEAMWEEWKEAGPDDLVQAIYDDMETVTIPDPAPEQMTPADIAKRLDDYHSVLNMPDDEDDGGDEADAFAMDEDA